MQKVHDAAGESAQNPHTIRERSPHALRRGDRVSVRGHRWRITAIDSYDTCRLLHLAGLEPENCATDTRVLTPFDRPRRLVAGKPRRVSGRQWRLALTALATGGALRTAAGAAIDIHPYQLDPALMLLRGDATRLLLADEVGLGKTIQAGLAMAELLAARRAHRVLVLSPAGLREQWTDELAARFRIDAQLVDHDALRRRAREIPRAVNPWRTWPVAVVSIDFAKRPDVLTLLVEAEWDIVVVDEAHGVAVAPERHDAVARLARQARYVLLLTATPHDGDERRFSLLTRLGEHVPRADPMIVVRRTRRDAGITIERRVHLLGVALTNAERRMHRLLAEYVRRVVGSARRRGERDAVLAMIVLTKRALSGAAPLARSLERRLVLLSSAEPIATQMTLPLDTDADGSTDPLDQVSDSVLACPGLDDVDEERRWLERVRLAAADSIRNDSKVRAIERLLRRTSEPLLVFTEYRDTLEALEHAFARYRPLTLHGGIEARRRTEVAEGFRRGKGRLLLATDVAAEGLNLHATCRLVVNLELPWTPSRLEQRIGRVDRIGQTRRVHAVHLLARGTAETGVLARLQRRLAAIRDRLGDAPLSVGPITDESILDATLTGRAIDMPIQVAPPAAIVKAAAGSTAEAARLTAWRRLWKEMTAACPTRPQDVIGRLETSRPWFAVERPRSRFPRGIVCVFRVRVTHGLAFDDLFVTLRIAIAAPDTLHVRPSSGCETAPSTRVETVRPAGLRALIRGLAPAAAHAQIDAQRACDIALDRARIWRDRLRHRETALVNEHRLHRAPVQHELFRRLPLPAATSRHAASFDCGTAEQESKVDTPELLLVLVRPR